MRRCYRRRYCCLALPKVERMGLNKRGLMLGTLSGTIPETQLLTAALCEGIHTTGR